MKRFIPIALWLFFLIQETQGQIITPQIKANFGVDADLRANFFDGFVVNGNDDWFSNILGTGKHIIDTVGASYIVSRYASDFNFRKVPFFRGMRYPQFSVINNRLLLDAILITTRSKYGGIITMVVANKYGIQ